MKTCTCRKDSLGQCAAERVAELLAQIRDGAVGGYQSRAALPAAHDDLEEALARELGQRLQACVVHEERVPTLVGRIAGFKIVDWRALDGGGEAAVEILQGIQFPEGRKRLR